MPSYDQLDNEDAWRSETAAPALKTLGERLRQRWPAAQIGIRGDNHHLNGYHRSRRWIKESRYCTNHGYSVSRTAGDKSGGDSNWACAMDFGGIGQSELLKACQRLDAAIRAGRLEKITEWYGNLGGDERVDGYDNIADRLASSDSSHLYHLHMSFDRGRANEDHSDLLAILTGDDDMEQTDRLKANTGWDGRTLGDHWGDEQNLRNRTIDRSQPLFPDKPGSGPVQGSALWNMEHLPELVAEKLTPEQLEQFAAKAGEHAAALVGGKLEALLAAMELRLEAKFRDAVADLGEGGSTAVRADAG